MNIFNALEQDDNFIMSDRYGRELEFKKVFVTKQKRSVYCILAPLGWTEAFVFKASQDGALRVCDKELSKRIFSLYYAQIRRKG